MMTPRLLRRASLIACCFLSPLAGAVIDCELNGTSINVNNGAETAGKSGLLRCRQRDGGELQRVQELRDGKTIGAVGVSGATSQEDGLIAAAGVAQH